MPGVEHGDGRAPANGPGPAWPDYGRILGRMEGKLDDLKEGAAARDARLDGLTERVRQNAHQANNGLQVISAAVERLQGQAKKAALQLDRLDGRVGALERPVRRALEQRSRRRRLWVKVVSVASVVSGCVWMLAEPLWGLLAEGLLRRLLGGP